VEAPPLSYWYQSRCIDMAHPPIFDIEGDFLGTAHYRLIVLRCLAWAGDYNLAASLADRQIVAALRRLLHLSQGRDHFLFGSPTH
jgi:hypothetical protein